MEYFLNNLNLFSQITIGVLAVTFLFQIIYYLVFIGRVGRYKGRDATYTLSKEPVSVIICARNEAENIELFLPSVLEQEYPDFEVIVVNDCSEDDTQFILERMQEKYSNLKISQIKHDEKFTHGKKLALTIGIKAAKNEWLLLTDADCKPAGKHWLSTMQRNFTQNNDIVLGYGGYAAEPGFVNKLIRFDTFMIAAQYLGFALNKIPYMGVGRNLAYRKSLFLENKGFASHSNIISGDDDLFINQVANKKNTRVEFSHEAHTTSVPKKTFLQWVSQKRRHYTTGYRYKFKHKFLLGLEVFTRLIFFVALVFSFFNPVLWSAGIAIYFLRLFLLMLIFSKALKRLKEKKLLIISPVFDFILPLINIFLYSVSTFNSKQHKWK